MGWSLKRFWSSRVMLGDRTLGSARDCEITGKRFHHHKPMSSLRIVRDISSLPGIETPFTDFFHAAFAGRRERVFYGSHMG